MNKVKAFLKRVAAKGKLIAVGAAVACSAAIGTVVASAESGTSTGLSQYSDQITKQFTTLAGDVVPIILGVLGAGLVIFGILAGIKFAKKAFGTVAK